jgi:hypothetical protein
MRWRMAMSTTESMELSLEGFKAQFDLEDAWEHWQSCRRASSGDVRGEFFLSFYSGNQPIVERIFHRLESFFGKNTLFYSDVDSTAGNWGSEHGILATAIRRARHIIVLLSAEALRRANQEDSRGVSVQWWEWKYSQKQDPPKTPIVVSLCPHGDLEDEGLLDIGFGYALDQMNWANKGGGDADLIAAAIVKSWHQSAPAPEPTPDAQLSSVPPAVGDNGSSPDSVEHARSLHFRMRRASRDLPEDALEYPDWERDDQPQPTSKAWKFIPEDHSGNPVQVDSGLRVLSPILGPGTLQISSVDERILLDAALDPDDPEAMDFAGVLGDTWFVEKVLRSEEQRRAFAQALIEGKLGDRDAKYSEEGTPRALTRLRMALLQLSMATDHSFGEAMSKTDRPLDGPLEDGSTTHVTRLPLDPRPLKAVRRAAEAAEAAAKDLKSEFFPNLDGPPRGHTKAQSSEAAPPTAWVDLLGIHAIHAALGRFKEVIDHGRGLRRDEVGWCADLFWHTMSYRAARYPTSSELYTQIVLLHESMNPVGLVTPHRMDPSRMVSALRDMETSAAAVRMSMGRGYAPGKDSRRSRFFGSLARAMWVDWRLRLKTRKHDDPNNRSKLSMAFAATFDFELESALARQAITDWEAQGRQRTDCPTVFHVVLPAVEMTGQGSTSRRGETCGHLAENEGASSGPWMWVLATYRARDFVAWLDPGDRDWLGRDDRFSPHEWHAMSDLDRYPEGAIDGPVVVRLNGSPFVELHPHRRAGSVAPDNEWADVGGTAVSYGLPLSISEYDRVQFLMMDAQSGLVDPVHQQGATAGPSSGWPAWFFTELKKLDRFWLAMGMGMQNWNSRLFLFLHTVRVLSMEGDRRPIRALEKDLDDDRVAFLTVCGIRPVVGQDTPRSEFLEDYRRIVQDDTRRRQSPRDGGPNV